MKLYLLIHLPYRKTFEFNVINIRFTVKKITIYFLFVITDYCCKVTVMHIIINNTHLVKHIKSISFYYKQKALEVKLFLILLHNIKMLPIPFYVDACSCLIGTSITVIQEKQI